MVKTGGKKYKMWEMRAAGELIMGGRREKKREKSFQYGMKKTQVFSRLENGGQGETWHESVGDDDVRKNSKWLNTTQGEKQRPS